MTKKQKVDQKRANELRQIDIDLIETFKRDEEKKIRGIKKLTPYKLFLWLVWLTFLILMIIDFNWIYFAFVIAMLPWWPRITVWWERRIVKWKHRGLIRELEQSKRL